jgi:hypothetical protein
MYRCPVSESATVGLVWGWGGVGVVVGWGGVAGIHGSNSVDITFSLSFSLFLAPFLLLFFICLSYSFLVYFCIPVSLLS